MSNTTITPTAGAIALLGLAMATSPITNYSWAALAESSNGNATPNLGLWKQAKLTVSGTLGAGGAAVIQGSNDTSNWKSLATVSDLVAPGVVNYSGVVGGLTVEPQANGLVTLAITSWDDGFKYLRATSTGGDGTTAISVNGMVSSEGAI